VPAIHGFGGFIVTANRTLIGHKCAGVIKAYAAFAGLPPREAFDVFYKSALYTEIREGISDMHCRSDGYLAEELQIEVSNVGLRPTTHRACALTGEVNPPCALRPHAAAPRTARPRGDSGLIIK
jgi:hypothetical protein